jgi:hypothetical protein
MKKEIVQSAIFSDIAGFYRRLAQDVKPNGKELLATCPFHQDDNPSLNINPADGRFHCFSCGAGGDAFTFYGKLEGLDSKTDFRRILEEIGELLGVPDEDKRAAWRTVATFIYQSPDGKPAYSKERQENGQIKNGKPEKRFQFFHYHEGKRLAGRPGDPLPYRLSELTQADTAFFVEGEGKAELLAGWGLTATSLDIGSTIPSGETLEKWRRTYPKYFRGKVSLIILSDNDDPGRRYADFIASELKPFVGSVKVVALPGLSPKGDIVDWVKDGGTKEKLRELVEATPEWEGPAAKNGSGVSDYSEVIPNIFFTDVQLFPTVPFPFDALSPKLSQIIRKLAKVMQVPPESVTGTVLSILSGAIGNSIWVSPKLGWQTSLFIWLIVIEKTGGGKSPLLNFLLAIVYKIQAIYFREYKCQLDEWERARRAKNKETWPTENEKPMLRHLITSDTTTEALGKIFYEWARGLIIHNDELSGLILGLNQYKKGIGNDRQKYLQLFDAAPFKIDRKSETIMTEKSGAAFLGGLQPELIPQIFDQSSFEDGLFPRFLMIFQKQTLRVFNDQSLNESEISFWESLYNRCLMLPWDPTGKPKTLIFSEDARRLWAGFHDESYQLAAIMTKNGAVFVPKLITYSLRLAGLLHVLDHLVDTLTITDLENLPSPRPIINRTMVERGIKITKYFAGQTMNVLAIYGKERKHINGQTTRLIQSIFNLSGEVKGGRLPLTRIRDEYNDGLPKAGRLGDDNKMLSGMLRGLGIETRRSGSGGYAHIVWEQEKFDKLFKENVTNITIVTREADQTSSGTKGSDENDDSDDVSIDKKIIDLTGAEFLE